MSTLVSGGYAMPERLHKDFSANLFSRETSDFNLLVQAATMPGFADGLLPLASQQLGGMRPMTRPMNLARRNSTSSVSSASTTRNSRMNNMNLNSLTSMANAIPETSAPSLSAALSSIQNLVDDRYRGRAFSEGASSLNSDSMQTQQQPVASSRYKTELCRPFEENGKCKYGDKCQFAHGKHELRHLARHPKYKTELCRTFHTSGFCPYGPRCHFIHNQDDSANRNSMAMQAATSVSGMTQQQSKPVTHGAPIAVPTPNISEQNHYDSRPAQLSLLTKQLSNGPGFATNIGYTGVPASPPYYDMTCSAVMSPTSPTSGNNVFSFSGAALAGMLSSHMQNDGAFEMLRSQGHYETTENDDSPFVDSNPTPPDSDRESLSGSPPGKQRLPIFRCLSQS